MRLAAVIGLLMAPVCFAQSDAIPDSAGPLLESSELAEVVVTGEQPGPALWKVSKGAHVLWILPEVIPLPSRMTWRSKAVEDVIGGADEVLIEKGIVPHLGGFGAVRFFARLATIVKNPDGARLADVLPSSLYARFSTLKARFAPNDEAIERWRPTFAAERLNSAAIGAMDLSEAGVIPQVERLAKKAKRRIVHIETDGGSVNAMLDNVKARPLTGCLEATIDRLETDTEITKARANAWATGDVAELRRLTEPSVKHDCPAELFGAERWQLLWVHHNEAWIAAVKDALERNAVTFAAVKMYQISTPDGWLDELRAQGYEVEIP